MTEPYYADEHVALYLGDCREVLPTLTVTPDSCVVDPPYGETSAAWDRWPHGWVDAVAAALPASAALWSFGSARMFLTHRDDFAGWRFAQEALWIKRNGSGPTSRDRLVKIHEWAYHWYRGRWSDLHHDWERMPSAGPDQSGGAGPREAVQDQPAGRGCTRGPGVRRWRGASRGVAAKLTGRRAQLIEADEAIAEIAARRLAEDILWP